MTLGGNLFWHLSRVERHQAEPRFGKLRTMSPFHSKFPSTQGTPWVRKAESVSLLVQATMAAQFSPSALSSPKSINTSLFSSPFLPCPGRLPPCTQLVFPSGTLEPSQTRGPAGKSAERQAVRRRPVALQSPTLAGSPGMLHERTGLA